MNTSTREQEEARARAMVSHAFAARQEIYELLTAGGKNWPHEAEARALIHNIEVLDTKLRAEHGAILRPRVVAKPEAVQQAAGRKSKLSALQGAILAQIEASFRERGYAPTIRELAARLSAAGITSRSGSPVSTSVITINLNTLAKKGYIERESGSSRALRLKAA